MMAHPLDGARAKLGRASTHIGALKRSIQRYIDLPPYEAEFTFEPLETHVNGLPGAWLREAGYDPVPLRLEPYAPDSYLAPLISHQDVAISLKEAHPHPGVRWGVILGDIVHNLRSALDHVVWELSVQASGPAPTPITRRWRDIAFPVVDDAARWSDRAAQHLWAVDQALLPRFEKLQPFTRGEYFRGHTLFRLNALWNRDKHQTINTTVAATFFKDLPARLTRPDGQTIQLRTQPQMFKAFMPLKKGETIARVRILFPDRTVATDQLLLAFDVHLGFEPRFPEPAPFGTPVPRLLDEVREFVEGVLAEFRGEFDPKAGVTE